MSAFESISQHPVPPGFLGESTSAAVSHPSDMAAGLARVSEHVQRLRELVGDRVDLRNASDSAISSAAAVVGEAIRDMLSVSTRMEESELLTLREEKAVLVLDALQMYLDMASTAHSFRREATHLIVKVADRSDKLPSSLFLKGVIRSSSEQLCGGYADVYQGMYQGSFVAIKMPRALLGDETDRKRMRREALVWRQLRHDHVLPFLGLDDTLFPGNKFSCMISPWMKRGMLLEYVKTRDYCPERDLLRMIRGTASGLKYLHSIKVIHGDLSDTNILIDDNHQPQLADFGLVLLEDCTRAGYTATGKNGFKHNWTSPQRLDDTIRSRSDDVYSFACLIYYLFSGMAPFQHLPTYRAIVEIMRGKRPVRPQATWSGASIEPSDAIWDLTERCWHAEPEMRLDISDVYSSLCLMNANDVSRHLHGEKPLPRKSEEDSLPTSHPIRSSSPMAQSPVKTPHFSGMSVLPRATGDAGDSGFESGDAGSSSSPRTTRQEYSACGACRMRRLKCNLEDVVVDWASGERPACSNCQERSLNCIDEYDKTVKIGKQRLLRRGRRIQGAEIIFGNVNNVNTLESSVPDLAPEFFQTTFFHRLQVQLRVIEPAEFIGRYQAYTNGESHVLGADGLLVAKVFVLWAAAFGLDEAGKEIDGAESSLALTPPSDSLAAKREGWGNRLTGMIRELIRLIDVHSILHKPTWDGVRVLLLFLPLLVEASDWEDAERLVIQETACSHIFTLCSRGSSQLAADGDQYTDALVRARVFWSACVREGTTTGLRGGRLVVTDEDLESFQSTLPKSQAHTPHVSPAQAAFQQARHFAQITIEISGACRLVYAALTGPRARQRMGEAHVDETILTRGWDILGACWHKLDGLRAQYGHIYAQRDEVDLFASGWQLFIFEAHNVIREALKQRILALGEAPYIHFPNNISLRTHVKGLHERALRHCQAFLLKVMNIIKSHIDLAQSSSFFAYDVALIRDACFFAPILLATVDYNSYASEDELRRDIDLCIHATRSMRFAYRRTSDRERSIEALWHLRRHRLAVRARMADGDLPHSS